jgi:glycosyltransferase involved in cell wall biosynthesis
MKLALAHDFLIVWGGAERVLKELHLMYPEAPIYVGIANADLVKEHFPHADIRTTFLQKSWKRKINQIMLMNMPRAVEEHDFTGYDVVLSSSGAFSHGIITDPYTYHVSYCHSPMRYVWDYHAEFLEERGLNRNWLTTLVANQIIHKLRTWDAVAASRPDKWLANSKTVQGRIKHFFRMDSKIINPPVDLSYFDSAEIETTRGKHMLSVSRISITKSIDQMIEACAKTGTELRIAGTGDDTQFRKLADELKAKVTFLGEVTEEQKRKEMAEAAAFLFPAEDDFGIAPVEAMSMGTPVIALGKGGATETVLNGITGIFYSEPTSDALAEALTKFKEKGVSGSEAAIRKQAQKFGLPAFQAAIRAEVENHA